MLAELKEENAKAKESVERSHRKSYAPRACGPDISGCSKCFGRFEKCMSVQSVLLPPVGQQIGYPAASNVVARPLMDDKLLRVQ